MSTDAGTPLTVLLNAEAGSGGADLPERLHHALRGTQTSITIELVAPQQLASALRRVANRGDSVVAVAGGDGTLLTAANTLAGTRTALVPIPTGTMNHFARRLGIEDVQTAARAIASGRVHAVALGVLNDRFFLNTMTFGLYADVLGWRRKLQRWLGRWPAAGVGFARALGRARMINVEIEVEGAVVRRTTPLVWVSVGRGSFPVGQEASERPRVPELQVTILRAQTRTEMLAFATRLAAALRTGDPSADDDPALEVLYSPKLILEAGHLTRITVDGELQRERPPFFVGVQTDALLVKS